MSISSKTTMQAYQLRAGGTRARMAILRMIAVESVKNRNESTRLQPGDWRGARDWTMASYAAAYGTLSGGLNNREPVWYSHAGEEFRNERDAEDIANLRHSGWYTDTNQNGLAIGIVASLPHGRYLAGYRWTDNDERVYFGQVFGDENDAARMGDEHARVFAESALEDSQRFEAMSEAEQTLEAKTEELADARALRRQNRRSSDDVREVISELRQARETLADAIAAYERE